MPDKNKSIPSFDDVMGTKTVPSFDDIMLDEDPEEDKKKDSLPDMPFVSTKDLPTYSPEEIGGIKFDYIPLGGKEPSTDISLSDEEKYPKTKVDATNVVIPVPLNEDKAPPSREDIANKYLAVADNTRSEVKYKSYNIDKSLTGSMTEADMERIITDPLSKKGSVLYEAKQKTREWYEDRGGIEASA